MNGINRPFRVINSEKKEDRAYIEKLFSKLSKLKKKVGGARSVKVYKKCDITSNSNLSSTNPTKKDEPKTNSDVVRR